jgi:adenosylmethionine-8-amino-7-oxononanoate aminotransferase
MDLRTAQLCDRGRRRSENIVLFAARRRIPFDSALSVGPRVDAASRRRGLILRVVGDRLVFAPPLSEIEEMAARLERGLDDVADARAREGALS